MTDPHVESARRRAPTANARLSELEAQARHASERYRLYRAKVYGPRAASLTRLRELEREAQLAETRLQGAKRAGTP